MFPLQNDHTLSQSKLIWGMTWWEPLYLPNITPCISLGAHYTIWLWILSSNYIGTNDYLGKRRGPFRGIIWVTINICRRTIQCVSNLMFLTISREYSCWNFSWRTGLLPAKRKLRQNYSNSLCCTIGDPPNICIQGVLDGFGYVLCAAFVCFVCFLICIHVQFLSYNKIFFILFAKWLNWGRLRTVMWGSWEM